MSLTFSDPSIMSLKLGIWEIDNLTQTDTFQIIQESMPRALAFSSDGLLLFVIGDTEKQIQVHLLTTPWDLTTANPIWFEEFDIGPALGVNFPHCMFISEDGLRIYVGTGSTSEIIEIHLMTPFDLATASVATTRDFGTAGTQTFGIGFSYDGKYLFISTPDTAGGPPDDSARISRFTCATPWDIDSISPLPPSTPFPPDQTHIIGGTPGPNVAGMFLRPDGTRIYVFDTSNDDLIQIDITTPWDLTTATTIKSVSMSGFCNDLQDMYFRRDGEKFYFMCVTGQLVHEFNLI